MKYIWRQINVWFAKETTRGTAVAPTFWFPKTNIDFDEKIETIVDESSLWVKVKATEVEVVKRTWEWSIEGIVRVNSIWLLFLNIFWKITTTELEENKAYNHKFEIENTNQAPSLSIWVDEANGDYLFALANLQSLTLNFKTWEYVNVNAEFKSKKWESASLSASYSADDYKFSAKHSIFKMADDLSWLSWASGICIESFEITFTKNLEEQFCLNSWVDLNDVIEGAFEISWNLTAVFNDETTFKNVALNWTTKAMEMKLVDTSIDLGWWNNPSIDIVLPKVAFTDYGRDKWNDNTVKQNLSFVWLQDLDSGKAVEVNVVNWTTSY